MDLKSFKAKIVEFIADTNLVLSGVAIVFEQNQCSLSASLGTTRASAQYEWPAPGTTEQDRALELFKKKFVIEGHPLISLRVLEFEMENPSRMAWRWQIGFRN